MRMRFFINCPVIFIIIILASQVSYAKRIVLPTGDTVRGRICSIKYTQSGQKYIKIVQLSFPQVITTSVGKVTANNYVYFYSNGVVEYCQFLEPQTIINNFSNNLLCKGGLNFYSNGQLRTCSLAEPCMVKISSNIVKVIYIEYYENGSIQNCKLFSPQEIESYVGNVVVQFIGLYDSGELEWLFFSDEKELSTSVGVIKVYGIKFYKSGRIKRCSTLGLQEIETPIGLVQTTDIYFYESGNIKRCYVGNYVLISTVYGQIMSIDVLKWYENGQISISFTDRDFYVNGINYKDKYIGWAEDGSFLGEFIYDEATDDYILKR